MSFGYWPTSSVVIVAVITNKVRNIEQGSNFGKGSTNQSQVETGELNCFKVRIISSEVSYN